MTPIVRVGRPFLATRTIGVVSSFRQDSMTAVPGRALGWEALRFLGWFEGPWLFHPASR